MTAVVEAPAKPMRADARRNYDALVAAAREMFAERGGDVCIEEIAKRAGVGVGTLYRHFPKRIDIVEAVYARDIDSLMEAADEAVAMDDAWAGLAFWLRAFVGYAETKRTFLTELHEAFEKNPDLRSASRERIAVAAGRVLARAQEAGAARPDVDQADVMQLIGGMCMSPTAAPGQNTRLLELVLDGLKPQA